MFKETNKCEACEYNKFNFKDEKSDNILEHTCGIEIKDMPIEKRMMNQIIDNIKLSSNPIFTPEVIKQAAIMANQDQRDIVEKESWIDKFDEIIKKYKTELCYFDLIDGYIPLKDFIKSEIDKAVKEERERISKILDAEKSKYDDSYDYWEWIEEAKKILS